LVPQENMTFIHGGSEKLECDSNALPEPTVFWTKDGKVIKKYRS